LQKLLREYHCVELRLGLVVLPETKAYAQQAVEAHQQLQAAEALGSQPEVVQQALQQYMEAKQQHERSKKECRRLTRLAVRLGLKIGAIQRPTPHHPHPPAAAR
jgi:DNA-binding SARP family transcriptional activator